MIPHRKLQTLLVDVASRHLVFDIHVAVHMVGVANLRIAVAPNCDIQVHGIPVCVRLFERNVEVSGHVYI